MLLVMPKISVSVSDEVHAAVRVRAFREGTSLTELGRRFFEGYGGLEAGVAQNHERPAAPKPDTGTPLVDAEAMSEPPPASNPRRKCSREARHHINHSGKPCPECGYPTA